MEYSGQVNKYKINRPLTEEERSDQLRQKLPQKVEPHYNLSVIRMNGTYLECVDKYYGFKGLLLLVSTIGVLILGFVYIEMLSISIRRWSGLDIENRQSEVIFLGAMALIWWPLIGGGVWLALRESFTFTHYPIRFNRNNRTVYVFRRNGSVLSVPWEGVFFTFGRGNNYANVQNWDIRGHMLDADGKTVRETFALAMDDNNRDLLIRHWEFVRRYMEDGPRELIEQVEMCLPIAERKETFWFGVTRMCANLATVPILFWVLSPILVLFGIGRYLAMLTCRVPAWPQEVEQACLIEPDDPYVKDARGNAK